MKVNREELKKYASLDDGELWRMIREMAKGYGYSISETVPPHEQMEKIRAILRGDTEISMAAALKILNTYKSKG